MFINGRLARIIWLGWTGLAGSGLLGNKWKFTIGGKVTARIVL
jgi:hypothetical protein